MKNPLIWLAGFVVISIIVVAMMYVAVNMLAMAGGSAFVLGLIFWLICMTVWYRVVTGEDINKDA